MDASKTNRKEQTTTQPASALRPLDKAAIDAHTLDLAQTVLETCTLDQTETLVFRGLELKLRRLDTRRFVLFMSRFLSMN